VEVFHLLRAPLGACSRTIATNCFPSTESLIGEETIGAPVWKNQSGLPDPESTAPKVASGRGGKHDATAGAQHDRGKRAANNRDQKRGSASWVLPPLSIPVIPRCLEATLVKIDRRSASGPLHRLRNLPHSVCFADGLNGHPVMAYDMRSTHGVTDQSRLRTIITGRDEQGARSLPTP
jgi:hypothetical protein